MHELLAHFTILGYNGSIKDAGKMKDEGKIKCIMFIQIF